MTLTKAKNPLLTATALLLGAAALLLAPNAARADVWSADPLHTEINFSVNHFFTPVSGRFGDFEVDLEYDPENPAASRVEAKIAVASVDTGNERRDNHLLSPDFFEADKYPYISFKSTSVEPTDDGLVARGDLTIKGKTQEVELPIAFLGSQEIPAEMQDMLGGTKQVASFKVATAVERNDFGVGTGSWAATLVVGGEVGIEILLEAHRR